MSTVQSDPTTLANNAQTVADSIESAKVAARVAAENKGQEIVLLDLSKQTSIFDCFLIVTGTSRRQLHAIAEEIDRELKKLGEVRGSRSTTVGSSSICSTKSTVGTTTLRAFGVTPRGSTSSRCSYRPGLVLLLASSLR